MDIRKFLHSSASKKHSKLSISHCKICTITTPHFIRATFTILHSPPPTNNNLLPADKDDHHHRSEKEEHDAPSPPPSKKSAPTKRPSSASSPTPSTKRKKTTMVIDLIDSDNENDLIKRDKNINDTNDGDSCDVKLDVLDSNDKHEEDSENDAALEDEKSLPSHTKRRRTSHSTPRSTTTPKKKKSADKKTPGKTSSASKTTGPLAAIADDPVAMEAVEAVNAAVENLPPLEDLKYSIMSEGNYIGRAPDEPLNRGLKEAPLGHPDCLTGKTFVISGVLDSLTRQEAEDLVKRHGGKVTSNVSSRTAFLVIGMHAGRSKFSDAKRNNTKVIDEDGLFSLIKATTPPPGTIQQQPQGAGAGLHGPSLVTQTFSPDAAVTSRGQKTEQPGKQPSSTSKMTHLPPAPDNGQLWVEKWRPKSSKELVGNATLINLFRHWLQEWEPVHIHKMEPTAPPGTGKKDRSADMKKKAVLLSGPPGIGKTSAALLVTEELGYQAVEVNASDTRSKADASAVKGIAGKLANSLKVLSMNTAISFDGKKKGHDSKKLCLIMDEVDGMSGGDRGGVADLIKTIKDSKVPIVCICNDKYSPKLKSLRNHCLELEFRKPTAQQISKRMLDIAAKEGLKMNQATMEALVHSANSGDIRMVLGNLQMIRLSTTELTYDQARAGGAAAAKDPEMSPFEAARRLLDFEACSSLSMTDQLELVFQDSDLVPLLVQENYLNHRPRIAATELHRMAVLSKASEGFSAGDVATRSVRQYQNWSLMPFAAAMGTVNPATYVRGSREIFGLYPTEQNFPRFTAWLGNFSSHRKQKRLLGEIHTRMLSSGHIECDRTALRLSYLPVLRHALVKPLMEKAKEGIPEVLGMMNDYCLSREDFDTVMDITKFKSHYPWAADRYKDVETATKTAFTKGFNAQHIKPKTGFGLEEGKKKKGRGRGAIAEDDEEVEAAMRGEEIVKEEEEEELDPVMVKQKLMALKHKGMSLTLKDGTEAKGGGGRGRGRDRGRGKGGKK